MEITISEDETACVRDYFPCIRTPSVEFMCKPPQLLGLEQLNNRNYDFILQTIPF